MTLLVISALCTSARSGAGHSDPADSHRASGVLLGQQDKCPQDIPAPLGAARSILCNVSSPESRAANGAVSAAKSQLKSDS